jgi:hypothetical protein
MRESVFAKTCILLLMACPLALTGCAPEFWQGFSQGFAGASAPPPAKLMIFGGLGHKTYLGCLNCSEYATDSILNQYGTYGSKYSSTSIFNRYGEFGSKFSDHSPCNPYASDPPVIVDQNGEFYGRLTVNRYHRQAPNNTSLARLAGALCE